MSVYLVDGTNIEPYLADGKHPNEKNIINVSIGLYAVSAGIAYYFFGPTWVGLVIVASVAVINHLTSQFIGAAFVKYTMQWSRNDYRDSYLEKLAQLDSKSLKQVIYLADKNDDIGTSVLAQLVLSDKEQMS